LTRQISILAVTKQVVRQDFYPGNLQPCRKLSSNCVISRTIPKLGISGILSPSLLKLHHSKIHSLMTELCQHRLASALRRMIRSGSRFQVGILPALTGAGALQSAASDLLTFLRAVLNYV
jgi:hypothetical protein